MVHYEVVGCSDATFPNLRYYPTAGLVHPAEELDETAEMCDDSVLVTSCLEWQPVTTFGCQAHHRVLQTCSDCTQNQYRTQKTPNAKSDRCIAGLRDNC